MITLLCSCLAARVDIYTVKRVANEEWLCQWSCLGNKADRSISLSLSLLFSVFPVVFSRFLPLFSYCSIASPPIIHSCVSFSHCTLSVWNKWGFVVANASYSFTRPATPYPQCFATFGDVHLTISNEPACVCHCRCFCWESNLRLP